MGFGWIIQDDLHLDVGAARVKRSEISLGKEMIILEKNNFFPLFPHFDGKTRRYLISQELLGVAFATAGGNEWACVTNTYSIYYPDHWLYMSERCTK